MSPEQPDQPDPRRQGARTESGRITPFALWVRHLRYPVLTLPADAGRPLTLRLATARRVAADLRRQGLGPPGTPRTTPRGDTLLSGPAEAPE
jgi:hypothetical protein